VCKTAAASGVASPRPRGAGGIAPWVFIPERSILRTAVDFFLAQIPMRPRRRVAVAEMRAAWSGQVWGQDRLGDILVADRAQEAADRHGADRGRAEIGRGGIGAA